MPVLIIIAIVQKPHNPFDPSEGSYKIYGAGCLPGDLVPEIQGRREGYLDKLDMLFSHIGQSWFPNFDLAKRHAALLQEKHAGGLLSEIIPILGMQGSPGRYVGYTYLDENETWVNEDHYKIEFSQAA